MNSLSSTCQPTLAKHEAKGLRRIVPSTATAFEGPRSRLIPMWLMTRSGRIEAGLLQKLTRDEPQPVRRVQDKWQISDCFHPS